MPENARNCLPPRPMTSLNYLEFDYSEDDEGTGTWDAIASVTDARLLALQAEIVQMLAWATHDFPGPRGPIEEGGAWDYDLHSEPDGAPLQTLHYDAAARQLRPEVAHRAGRRHTFTLSLSGNRAFAEALQAAFGLD